MQLTHFPFSIRSIVAVNVFVCAMAVIVFALMLLAGAVSPADVDTPEPQVAGLVEVADSEPSVSVSSVVIAREADVAAELDVEPTIVIETEVSSVAIIRRP